MVSLKIKNAIAVQIAVSATCGAVLGSVLGGAVALAVLSQAALGDGQERLVGIVFVAVSGLGLAVGAVLGGRATARHLLGIHRGQVRQR